MSSQMEKSVVEVSTVAAANCHCAPVITTTTDHGLEVGDIITYVNSGSATEQIIGLESGRSYKVEARAVANTFTLCDIDGTDIAYGAGHTKAMGLDQNFLNSLGNAPSVGITGSEHLFHLRP